MYSHSVLDSPPGDTRLFSEPIHKLSYNQPPFPSLEMQPAKLAHTQKECVPTPGVEPGPAG